MARRSLTGCSLLIRAAPWVIVLFCHFVLAGKYEWMKRDNFDIIDDLFQAVKGSNCRSKSKREMLLRPDVVSQIPKANQLKSTIIYKNRTNLVHMHNMALNRAYFMSYILQKMNDTELFYQQPNIHYLYMSVTADMNANPSNINGSSIVFDNNCYYPNWFVTLDFNNTIPLFGVKGWRWDDTYDQDNYLREPTRRAAYVTDIGAGTNKNYTTDGYKMNPWYNFWLPDTDSALDKSKKFTFGVGIKYSNVTGKFTNDNFDNFNFFGPNLPKQQNSDETLLPVRFTQPYFDCRGSKKWKVSAVAPIVDFMPRYSNWTHLRRQRIVGVIVMDTDFQEIDFNACGTSPGNPGPSYLSGISRCKGPSTGCKHKMGYGRRRGGYVCHCKNPYRYPRWISPPFQGDDVERATDEEYKNNFECVKDGQLGVLPIVDKTEQVVVEFGVGDINVRRRRSENYLNGSEPNVVSSRSLKSINVDDGTGNKYSEKAQKKFEKRQQKEKLSPIHLEDKLRKRRKRTVNSGERSEFDQMRFEKMIRIFRQKASINKVSCRTSAPSLLHLPGDVAYGVDRQFDYQGRTALRLAHFLSNFLQNVQASDNFGNLRGGGRLHMEQMFGEVIANVMADHKILSCGLYFEPYTFENQDGSKREMFGPFAYMQDGRALALDTAGNPRKYIYEDFYVKMKANWKTNFEHLHTYKMRPMVRYDPAGTSQIRFEYFPMRYKAPDYNDGQWSHPYFRCDGMVDEWIMTYSAPFFKKNYISNKIEFAGVITVDVPLDKLEVNQCPQPFHVANAFKNTARCHTKSTKCKPQAGFKFSRGAYRCDCKQGHEYQIRDGKFWIEGSLIELEYEKKQKKLFSRFDQLICRISGAPRVMGSFTTAFVVTMYSLVMLHL
ncbi:uncharacterized protein LOC134722188 [Mytilus trossulus]|uniref:uncharacterized protein LOC134722188 n=1 Tax=Mytilus trossulus TaxID=6551 RepID=UPI0030075F46